jgi:ankyrin repeat protein
MTPLLHAASIDFGDVEMVKLLLASGADAHAPMPNNISAEQLAIRYGHSDIARALADK